MNEFCISDKSQIIAQTNPIEGVFSLYFLNSIMVNKNMQSVPLSDKTRTIKTAGKI